MSLGPVEIFFIRPDHAEAMLKTGYYRRVDR
jgi:hypothetical protein